MSSSTTLRNVKISNIYNSEALSNYKSYHDNERLKEKRIN